VGARDIPVVPILVDVGDVLRVIPPISIDRSPSCRVLPVAQRQPRMVFVTNRQKTRSTARLWVAIVVEHRRLVAAQRFTHRTRLYWHIQLVGDKDVTFSLAKAVVD